MGSRIRKSYMILILTLITTIFMIEATPVTNTENNLDDIFNMAIYSNMSENNMTINNTLIVSNNVEVIKDTVDKEVARIEEEERIRKEEEEKQRLYQEYLASKSTVPYVDYDDLRVASNISPVTLREMLKDSKLQDLTETFVWCEENLGINAIFLMGLTSLESGHGTSSRSTNGSNNLTGYNVTSNSSRGTYFDSWDECVISTAKLIKEQYLTSSGTYYSGGFSIYDVGSEYCASSDWAKQIVTIINNKKKNIKQ